MNYEIINLTDNKHNLITDMLNNISQIKNILSTITSQNVLLGF